MKFFFNYLKSLRSPFPLIDQIFDLNLYNTKNDIYQNACQTLNFTRKNEVEYLFNLIKKNSVFQGDFNPIKYIVEYFNYAKLNEEVACHFFDNIVNVIKDIFDKLSDENKNIVLQTLYCFQNSEATHLFINYISNREYKKQFNKHLHKIKTHV